MPVGIAITPVLQVPIGGVAAWLKSYTNTPALPSGWIECNGQTLNDPESIYNGQTIPNLNSGNRFLRGNSTTGGTGGAASVTLTIDQMPSHCHDLPLHDIGTDLVSTYNDGGGDNGTVVASLPAGGGQSHENLPPYYNIVWIMRVK